MNEVKYDLEERLIEFAVRVIRLAEYHSPKRLWDGIFITSCLAVERLPLPIMVNEAQSAESRADFVHKLKIVLKELRETRVWLLIIRRAELVKPTTKLKPLIQECDELISVFVTSLKTATRTNK